LAGCPIIRELEEVPGDMNDCTFSLIVVRHHSFCEQRERYRLLAMPAFCNRASGGLVLAAQSSSTALAVASGDCRPALPGMTAGGK
jgi:hypothetical protein